jgi:hypothetical protein
VTDEIHDMSRVDAFMASRRRAMIFHSVWKPMLAGAVGAALIVATVWAAMPKFHYNDIEIPRVTVRDVTVDHVVPRDVPVDHVVPHDVPVDHIVPHDVPMPGPSASAAPPAPGPIANPTMGPQSPYAAKTPEENKFVDQPKYRDATYHGRIIKSVDGKAVSFADGKSFWPYRWNESAGKTELDGSRAFQSDQYIGDLAMCVQREDQHNMWFCTAFHDGKDVPVAHSLVAPTTSATQVDPAPSALNNGGKACDGLYCL